MKVEHLIGSMVFVLLGALSNTASAQTCLTIVRIDATGKIERPQTMACHPDDRVLWIVVNDFAQNIQVTFDTFQIRGTTTPADPLSVSTHPMTVTHGDVDVSKAVKVRSNGQFGSATLPFGGFKYSITVNQVGGGNTQTDRLDPDLDVTPPPSPSPVVPPGGRGRGRGGLR